MWHWIVLVTTVSGLLSASWGARCFIGGGGERCSPEDERIAIRFFVLGAALVATSVIVIALTG